MITHGRETYQPTSIMRWDRGIFNGSHDRLTSCIPMSLLWGYWNPGGLGPFNSPRFQVNDIRWMVAKSCTSWEVVYPIFYRVLTIQGDAGFLPSTVTYYLSLIQLNIEIYLVKTNTCNKIGPHDKHISKRETYGFKQWICHQTNAKQMNSTEMYCGYNQQQMISGTKTYRRKLKFMGGEWGCTAHDHGLW